MNNLENGLRLLAVGCAMSYGFGFSAQSFWHLSEFIHQGIEKLHPVEPNSEQILKAQNDIVRFVSMMVDEAIRQNDTELKERTFDAVREIFCPCPPWC